MAELDNDAAVWAKFNRKRFDVRVRVCCCPVLKDCWTFDSTQPEPTPIEVCPAVTDANSWHG
jgi:hypothetical protein